MNIIYVTDRFQSTLKFIGQIAEPPARVVASAFQPRLRGTTKDLNYNALMLRVRIRLVNLSVKEDLIGDLVLHFDSMAIQHHQNLN